MISSSSQSVSSVTYPEGASQAAVVCQALLDPAERDDYMDEINEEYEEMREEHYSSLLERRYAPLATARQKALQVDWANHAAPVKPAFLGNKHFKESVPSCNDSGFGQLLFRKD